MIKLIDAINFLEANGHIVKTEKGLYHIIEVRSKKHKFSHLEIEELIRLVEKMIIGIYPIPV